MSFALWTCVLVLSGGISLTAAGGAGARVADASTPTITAYPLPAPPTGGGVTVPASEEPQPSSDPCRSAGRAPAVTAVEKSGLPAVADLGA